MQFVSVARPLADNTRVGGLAHQNKRSEYGSHGSKDRYEFADEGVWLTHPIRTAHHFV